MSDPRGELLAIARAAGAYLEQLRDSGVEELSRATRMTATTAPTTTATATTAPTPTTTTTAASTATAAPTTTSTAKPSPEERRRRLAVIAEEVAACTRCELHKTRTNTAFARGNPDSALVFVGEGPGAQEDRLGAPFVGPAGQLLDKMIAAMGYERDDVYVMNITKCRATEPHNPNKDRKPEPAEVAACRPFLEGQLACLDPKVIVALGATAVQGLTGASTGITRMRGVWRLFDGRIPLMPTFHPAYLLRAPDKKREVWDDMKQVMQRLRDLGVGPPPR